MRLRSLTFDELVQHGVDRRFARILSDPEGYHADLNIIVGKTNWDYFIPDGVTDVVPLWDVNANSFVRWNRNGKTEYVWLFHDDPNWTPIARSEQGIMATLWKDWIEFQDSDSEPRRFADAIGFRHCDEALALLDSDCDAFTRWVAELSDTVA
jgi:hypothetical protein